jgi:hypothetical protein
MTGLGVHRHCGRSIAVAVSGRPRNTTPATPRGPRSVGSARNASSSHTRSTTAAGPLAPIPILRAKQLKYFQKRTGSHACGPGSVSNDHSIYQPERSRGPQRTARRRRYHCRQAQKPPRPRQQKPLRAAKSPRACATKPAAPSHGCASSNPNLG